jgi:alpha-ketoglutarate-dependent 2,4-dichlorophenoxyacetate dioxygenase
MALAHMHIRTYERTSPPRPDGPYPGDMEHGSLIVTPVLQFEQSVFGAEVSGVDWSKPVPSETVTQVSSRKQRGRSGLTL